LKRYHPFKLREVESKPVRFWHVNMGMNVRFY